MTYDDLADLEILPPMAEQDHAKDTLLARVLVRTDRAKRAGLDGVIASAQEAKAIREHCGCGFDIVTPAIRPMWAAVNDQKRPTTPADAISAGADYLVIGRPILKPPAEIGAPENAIDLICEEIESVRV
ncbi:MAG: orotidine 5'-phosphate decarboxylase / HUMPS family protein, partial [Patescibacteria group bacterium]